MYYLERRRPTLGRWVHGRKVDAFTEETMNTAERFHDPFRCKRSELNLKSSANHKIV